MLLETIRKKKSRGVICPELLKVHKVRLREDEKWPKQRLQHTYLFVFSIAVCFQAIGSVQLDG